MDITIALGGGGAKGNPHFGVLRALEREGSESALWLARVLAVLLALFLPPGEAWMRLKTSFNWWSNLTYMGT